MVVAPKSNGKVRVWVNLGKLNKYGKQENHPLPAVDTTLGSLAGYRVSSELQSHAKRVETLCLLKRILRSQTSLCSLTPPPHFNVVAAIKIYRTI